jgi:hypothetical protein
MKTVLLKYDFRKKTRSLKGQFPDSSHVCRTVRKNTKLIGPDGTIVAVFLCNAIPWRLHKLAYELWRSVDSLPSNRATAVGSPSFHRLKSDGSLSKRLGVVRNVLKVLKAQGAAQDVIGYSGSSDRRLHKTPLTKKHPEMLAGNKQLILLVDELYKKHLSTFYANQNAVIEKTPQWRLWQTVFSTIYIAKNFRTAYHRDGRNLPGMSALMPMGKFTGGELVLPRWRIAFAFKPGDLLFFDSRQHMHGNLPFVGERLSAIFFRAGLIAKCCKSASTPVRRLRRDEK